MSSLYLSQNFPQDNINIRSNSITVDSINVQSDSVTQLTSVTQEVTINSEAGTITTYTSSAAALSVTNFFVLNENVLPGDTILVDIGEYTGTLGTNGFPLVQASNGNTGAGVFVMSIMNVHPTAAFAGIFKIRFQIIHPV